MKAFSPLLRLKLAEEFIWGKEQQKAFDQIKESLTNSPVLTPPAFGRHLKLYILATDDSISNLLAQDAEEGAKRVVCYLSLLLNDAEMKNLLIEKLYLSLFHAYQVRVLFVVESSLGNM